ncbi:methyl-accepting chemotaxis protein [Sphingomonas aerophila]|nr:HAMP domain-containing methyl-accepting chemotaxis protein [Sphingomonas aerophila]
MAIVGLVVLCGGAGVWSTWQQSAALRDQQEASELLRNHMNADMMHDAIRADVLAALQARDPKSGLVIADVRKDLTEHAKSLKVNVDTDVAFKSSPEVSAATSKLVQGVDSYVREAEQISELAANNPNAADAELKDFVREFHVLEGTMESASDAISAYSLTVSGSAESLGRIAMAVLLLTLAAAVGGALFLARQVRSHLVKPLLDLVSSVGKLAAGDRSTTVGLTDRRDELGALAGAIESFRGQLNAAEAAKDAQARLIVDSIGNGLSALAAGDLTVSVNAELAVPFDTLKTNFNAALAGLRELIGSVTDSAHSIRTGSSEIAQASEDLARRTESNAASLEQTSAAIAQIDGRLRASANAATQTVTRADGAMGTVSDGRELASGAMAAMNRVAESAKGIDSVIEGLDKIAFQTRVLAMNAAVEAGRAGEAGRGFAVVADLVGALAMRSEEEAKRAREQLTATSTDVVAAVGAVEKVDDALSRISSDVAQVHELLGQMATDNQAQSSAITQIAAAIGTMDHATQQNAAMVEETSAAARNLSGEVQALSEQAGRFRVDTAGGANLKDRAKASAYVSPVKPLPAAAITALTRPTHPPTADEGWNAF